MSEIFIQNEAIRSKIQAQYFANNKSKELNKIPGFGQDDEENDDNISNDDLIDEYEPEDISPISNNLAKSFEFLGLDEGTISREFTLCSGETDITKKYNVQLCSYMINNSNEEYPFLQYMMQLEGDQFTFPKFVFKCAANIQTDEDEEMTPEHVYFQNECTKHILDVFIKGIKGIKGTVGPTSYALKIPPFQGNQGSLKIPPFQGNQGSLKIPPLDNEGSDNEGSDNEGPDNEGLDNDGDSQQEDQDLDDPSISHIYKGYVVSSSNSDQDPTIYVLFDMTGFDFKSDLDQASKITPIKRIWGTIDEIVNVHEILGYKVDPTAVHVFYQTPTLMHIKNGKGEILDNPSIMFMCKSANPTTITGGQNILSYENVYNEPAIDSQDKSPIFSLIDERIDHPILGNFFIFSVSPLNFNATSKSIFDIKRCVSFIHKPVYILTNLTQVNLEEKNDKTPEFTLGSVIPSIVEYMSPTDAEPDENLDVQEPTNIKEIKGGNNVETNDLGKELEPNLGRDLKSVKQSVGSFNNLGRDLKGLRSQPVGSLNYFQEYVGNDRIPFWCIKSTLDFTEL